MPEQGTDEWFAARCGKVTASRISDVMAGGKGITREKYMAQLACERLTGVVHEHFKSAAMKWGNDNEDEAADAYAFRTGETPQKTFFYDHPRIALSGASPDRLIGDDGLLEIKCPEPHTHIAYFRGKDIDSGYKSQMQWQMACTDRLWCDWVSYDPRLSPGLRLIVRRVERDTLVVSNIQQEVEMFQHELKQLMDELKRLEA